MALQPSCFCFRVFFLTFTSTGEDQRTAVVLSCGAIYWLFRKAGRAKSKAENGLPFVGYSEHYYCISILASLQTCFRVFALFLYFTVFHFHLLILLTLNLNFDIKKIQFNACKLNETNTCSCARVLLQTISEQSRL